MSDLLNSASLVMIPSGYKEDVVYSQIPTDGSGDLSFTRASNGTRVNSAGLVEVAPWNIVEYSEDFSNAYWPKSDTTITANAIAAPNGTTTADKLIATATNANHLINKAGAIPVISGQSYTFSLYAKAAEYSFVRVQLQAANFPESWANFNLSNGTIGLTTGVSGTIESVGNGWYRCSITQTATGTGNSGLQPFVLDSNRGSSSPSYTGDGTSGIYIWGAQLNIGSTAKPYFPTTDRLNVPRLTYQNGGGGCPSLLLEKQSTNLVLHSEQFDATASWSYSECSVTANQTISPDGTQNADKLVENSANTIHEIYQGLTLTGGTAYTNTIYAKSAERTQIAINFVSGGFGQGSQVIANLSTGTLGTITNYGGVTGSTATITNVGNDWYRISLTMTPVSTTTFYADYSPAVNGNAFYQGNGTSGIYIWGAQIEASSYATSYIPTTSSSATRVADEMTVNLPNTNMTFTAYLECEEAPLGTTATDWLQIYNNASILGRAYGYDNVFGFADAYSLGVASGTKMVWKQESGSTAKIFTGGALVGTSTTGTYSNPFNRFSIYGAYLTKSLKIKQFVFFDNALTDAECAQLTA